MFFFLNIRYERDEELSTNEVDKNKIVVPWKSIVKVFEGTGSDHLCKKSWKGQIQCVRRSKRGKHAAIVFNT